MLISLLSTGMEYSSLSPFASDNIYMIYDRMFSQYVLLPNITQHGRRRLYDKTDQTFLTFVICELSRRRERKRMTATNRIKYQHMYRYSYE